MKIESEKLLSELNQYKKKYKFLTCLFGKDKKFEASIKTINGVISIIERLIAEEEKKAENQANYKIDINLFDEEKTYTDCTVQVLHNSITDEYSVGWWENKKGVI